MPSKAIKKPAAKAKPKSRALRVKFDDDGCWLRSEEGVVSPLSVETDDENATQRRRRRHFPLYVFLMKDIDAVETPIMSVEVSSNPFRAVQEYITQQRPHWRNKKSHRRRWRLLEWIGPFARRDEATAIRDKWQREKGSLDARLVKGVEFACALDINVYTFDVPLLKKLVDSEHIEPL